MRIILLTVLCFVACVAQAQAKSWIFDASMTPAAKHIFLKQFSHGKTDAKQLLAKHADSTVIELSPSASVSTAIGMTYYNDGYYYDIVYSGQHLQDNAVGRHVIFHELGHIVDYSGISKANMKRFMTMFKRSSRWQNCFNQQGGCVQEGEIFAEQFAYWAAGGTQINTVYGVPPLINRVQFGKLLERSYHWAPADYRASHPY